MESNSLVYNYFTLVTDLPLKNQSAENTSLYYCNICKENGRTKNNEPIICRMYKKSTSNLIHHLRNEKLKDHLEALHVVENSSTGQSSKRKKLEFLTSPSLLDTGAVKIMSKYPPNSVKQNEK